MAASYGPPLIRDSPVAELVRIGAIEERSRSIGGRHGEEISNVMRRPPWRRACRRHEGRGGRSPA
ncbi:MAG: hypothetical protein CMJ23_01640 [Phycisphaerae bacterium]|nr:hypothetical protein [Phycisphaerae bacterium]